MNRETKFRGRDKYQKWHYGFFWKSPDGKYWIKEPIDKLHSADFEIIPETVGQYIGRNDNQHKEIYEKDFIEYFNSYAVDVEDGKPLPLIGIVKWNQESCTYEPLISACEDFNNNCFAYVCDGSSDKDAYYKVIGNVFDNPEIKEKKRENWKLEL